MAKKAERLKKRLAKLGRGNISNGINNLGNIPNHEPKTSINDKGDEATKFVCQSNSSEILKNEFNFESLKKLSVDHDINMDEIQLKHGLNNGEKIFNEKEKFSYKIDNKNDIISDKINNSFKGLGKKKQQLIKQTNKKNSTFLKSNDEAFVNKDKLSQLKSKIMEKKLAKKRNMDGVNIPLDVKKKQRKKMNPQKKIDFSSNNSNVTSKIGLKKTQDSFNYKSNGDNDSHIFAQKTAVKRCFENEALENRETFLKKQCQLKINNEIIFDKCSGNEHNVINSSTGITESQENENTEIELTEFQNSTNEFIGELEDMFS